MDLDNYMQNLINLIVSKGYTIIVEFISNPNNELEVSNNDGWVVGYDGEYLKLPIQYDNKNVFIYSSEYLKDQLDDSFFNTFISNHIILSPEDNLNVDELNSKFNELLNDEKFEEFTAYIWNKDTWEVLDGYSYSRRSD